ncbi:MAG: ABC-F type ribosomal protection protein [Eubacterium sp.]|nr:ABC-F type ribosomal protection protein [Eubacterium sp.]
MILACQNISKAFGDEKIIQHASFHLEENEKAAIVGINGAGKTTLLKMLVGEYEPEEGTVTFAKGKTFGYLAQIQEVDGDAGIYEEVLKEKADIIRMEEKLKAMEDQMSEVPQEKLEKFMEDYHKLHDSFEAANGYAYRSEVTGIIKGLGFQEKDFQKKMSELSGGQKTRVCLCKLLVSKPDLIILDEPTNHLDIESIAWLENYLLNYKGAVLIVSHDRYFLDKIVTKVIEVAARQVSVYDGNYTAYAKKSRDRREALLKQYYNQQQEIKHQEEVIEKLKSFNREKSIRRAESREKALEKIERLEKPAEENAEMRLALTPRITSGNDVLRVECLSKSFDTQQLFSKVDFELKRGERVALIGANGTGKTTMLKIINGLIEADGGTVTTGANVQIGYYDQEYHVLHSEKTIFEEISDTYPELNNTQIRNVLAAFLFTGEEVFKQISSLSGGEKGRVSLAKLMLSNANFLILDEPTNHLDIISEEILEEALNSYSGTVFFVSHDRYFINRTATRILCLDRHSLVNYLGNYDYYLEKKAELTPQGEDLDSREKKTKAADKKADWARQKEEAARKRKLENELQRTERQIAEKEAVLKEIDAEMMKPDVATNSAKLNELSIKKEKGSKELEILYQAWEELADQI